MSARRFDRRRGRAAPPPFNPALLGGAKRLWLRGYSGPNASSGAISAWVPYEGAALQFAQGSGALQPWARYVNARLAVDYDGGDGMDGPTKGAVNLWLQTPAWIAAAVLVDALSAGTNYMSQGILADNSNIAQLGVSTTGVYHVMYDTTVAPQAAVSATVPLVGVPQVVIGTHNGSSSITAQVVGGAAGSHGSAAPISGASAHILRLGNNSPGTAGLDGCICELIALNTIPNAATQALILDYLGRWTRSSAPVQRLMCCGDSITVGYISGAGVGTGGWRKHLATGLPLSRVFVGPSSDAVGAHRGVAGEKAQDVVSALATFAGQVVAATPTIVILAWGTNDLGTGRTPAQLAADMQTIITQVRTSAPNAIIVLPTVVAPTSGAYFANIANYSTYNTTTLPALATANSCMLIDIGAMTGSSDGTHPPDGRTGYDSLAHAMTRGLLAVY